MNGDSVELLVKLFLTHRNLVALSVLLLLEIKFTSCESLADLFELVFPLHFFVLSLSKLLVNEKKLLFKFLVAFVNFVI